MKNSKRKIIAASLTILLISSPGLNTLAADGEKTITESFTTTDPSQTYEFPAEIENGEYKLVDVKYTVTSEKPIMTENTITHTVETVVIDKSEPIAESFETIIDGHAQMMALDEVTYEPTKIQIGQNGIDTVTAVEIVEYSRSDAPETVTVDYTDSKYDITVPVTLTLQNIDEIEGRYEYYTLPMTFFNIEAAYYVFDGQQVPNNPDTPTVKGYEDIYLQHLGLDAYYQITGASWSGTPYEFDGVLCRDASCYVQRYVPVFAASYGGDNITLPEVDGYNAIAKYKGVVSVETGDIEYTIQATALYTEDGLSTTTIALLSIGLSIILLVILAILFSLAQKKKKRSEE